MKWNETSEKKGSKEGVFKQQKKIRRLRKSWLKKKKKERKKAKKRSAELNSYKWCNKIKTQFEILCV